MSRWSSLRKAFATTPDRARVYPATVAEIALARLLAGLDDGESLLVATGLTGTGKTLLAYRLLEQVGPRRRSILLTNSHLGSRSALLQACLFDLELPHEGKSEQELRLTLTAHLLETLTKQGSVVLVVDEAHHLDDDLLEELRLVGNLEAGGQPALQVVLIGLEVLEERLADPGLAAIQQRVGTWTRLEPLDLAEAIDYVTHLLRTASLDALDIVPEEVRAEVAEAANGIPRRLNLILREALRIADEIEADVVDIEMVHEALSRLGLEGVMEPEIRFDPEPEEGPLAA